MGFAIMSTPRNTISNKTDMYRLLSAGHLGNTLPMWGSVAEFEAVKLRPWKTYGIRSKKPRGVFNAFVPYDEVAEVCRKRADDYVISPMVDDIAIVTLWANVYENESGLNVEYVTHPERGVSWREGMQHPTHVVGINARMILKHHLNSASFDDLEILLGQYRGHVVELSALDRCIGTVSGRNAVIWEVRGNY